MTTFSVPARTLSPAAKLPLQPQGVGDAAGGSLPRPEQRPVPALRLPGREWFAAHQATPCADRLFDLRARPLGVPAGAAQARVARIRHQLAGLALTA